MTGDSEKKKQCLAVDFGLIGYAEACELQRRLVAARKANAAPDLLLLCEHPHVITLGRNGKREHLRASEQLLRQMNVEFHATNRGGDITYHGPGQLVGYPILQLAQIRRDIVWYVRQLEEAMIRASGDYGIAACRIPGFTGVWVDMAQPSDASQTSGLETDRLPSGAPAHEKLAAIGVHISRWVTSHGFAYNVATDLRYFDLIVPCGIRDKRPTSLERLLGRPAPVSEFAPHLVSRFGEVFGLEMHMASRAELEEALAAFEDQNASFAPCRPEPLAAT